MAVTAREAQQVERANATERPPVVFIHGLWLLANSWDRWVELFEEAGYAPVATDWPGDPDTVEQAKATPEAVGGIGLAQIADHQAEVIGALNRKPVVMGHSNGGLLAEMVAGRGLAATTVAISPAPFRGVLPLPLSTLRVVRPVLRRPANRKRGILLTYEQFRYGFANAVNEQEARDLYDRYSVPGSGAVIFQAALANLDPRTEARVDTGNPARGPLLIISATEDHTVPWAIAHASFKRQRHNAGVTEITKMPARGHSLTIDGGWRQVADSALAFVRRFVEPGAS